MTTEYSGFFDDTVHKVVDGNIVYASDLNNPLAALKVGGTAVANALQTGNNLLTAADTGTANAYILEPTAALTEYSDGQMVWLKPANTNTGASTINVSSLGAKSVRCLARTALVGGELVAGYWFKLKYSSTLDAFIIVSDPGKTDVDLEKTVAGGTGIAVSSDDDTITVDIEDGGVDTDQLADEAVTGDKIADATITQEKIESFPDVVRNDIDGGDITTSSQTITITACSCWDSTRTVWLEITTSKTVRASSVNNEKQYVFLVKLVSDGSCEFRRYSTYAGVDSDAQVSAYRFISWAKNDGSGVLMPYRQVGDKIWWVGSGFIQITASLTTSFVNYSISSLIPVAYLKSFVIAAPANSSFVSLSYDGSYTHEALYNGNTGNETSSELAPVSAIYAKYSSAGSALVVNAITLRR